MDRINAGKFYAIFNDYSKLLKLAGFSKKSRNKYTTKDDIELSIVLDKWGWDDEYGWGFLIRLTDWRGVDKKNFEGPRAGRDIKPHTLIQERLISEDELKNLYRKYLNSHPKLYEQVQHSWYAFYDEKHLHEVLARLMPLISARAADQLSMWREEII